MRDGILTLHPSEIKTLTARCEIEFCLMPMAAHTKITDFADFQGPPAASAYWQQVKGAFGNERRWLEECLGEAYKLGDNLMSPGSSIREELYFPRISLPSMITELQPEW
jgi:hypothetical protein